MISGTCRHCSHITTWKVAGKKHKRLPARLTDFSPVSESAILDVALLYSWLFLLRRIDPSCSVFKCRCALLETVKAERRLCSDAHAHSQICSACGSSSLSCSFPRLHWRQSSIHILWVLDLLHCSCLITWMLERVGGYGFVSLTAPHWSLQV